MAESVMTEFLNLFCN